MLAAMSWPPHALRLTTPDLVLRAMTEQDALALAEVVPSDLELDPHRTHFSPGASVLQAYWRALGTWQPDDWALPFTVLHDHQPVGVQFLEAKDFPVRRTVDSYSWLVGDVRGQGLGKQMRAAVLTLAFGHLGAEFAVTEAWQDNAASLGVSASLGYIDNGVDVHAGPRLMARRLLPREAWRSPYPVEVSGVDGCLPLFGL